MKDDKPGKIQIKVRLFGKHDGGMNEEEVHSFTASPVKKICELLFGKIKSDKKVRFANQGLEKLYSIGWNDDLYSSQQEMIYHLASIANERLQKSNEVNEMLECSDYEKIILNFDKKSRELARTRFELSTGFIINIGDESIAVEPLMKRKDIYLDGDKWYAVDTVNIVDSDHNAIRCKCGKTPVMVKFSEDYRPKIFDAARDRASLKLQIIVQKDVLASDSKSVSGELIDLKVFKQEKFKNFDDASK